MTSSADHPPSFFGARLAGAERFRHDHDFARGFEAARCAGAARLEDGDRIGLLVFNQAAAIAGQLAEGIAFLTKEHGLDVVYAQWFMHTEASVTRLWGYQLATFRVDRWRLIIELLTTGPCLGLVLRTGSLEGFSSLSDRLKALKGPSEPVKCSSAQLRRRLGAMNRILNFLHAADETVDLVRETAIIFRGGTLEHAWRSALGGNAMSQEDLANIVGVAHPQGRWGGVSFAHVTLALRFRLAIAVAPSLPACSVVQRAVGIARDDLVWVDSQAATDPLQTLARLRSRADRRRVAHLFRSAIGEAAPSPGIRAITELEAAIVDDRCDLDHLWEQCRQADVVVDSWERLVISTQQVMASVVRGEHEVPSTDLPVTPAVTWD